MTNGSLTKVESIAECSPWSILQYFWPALSDKLAGFQLFACISKHRSKQCRSWSAGFSEASWSGSSLFSKQDRSGFNMVKQASRWKTNCGRKIVNIFLSISLNKCFVCSKELSHRFFWVPTTYVLVEKWKKSISTVRISEKTWQVKVQTSRP